MEFESEIKNLIKGWTLAIISLSYCYYIASKLPHGVPRLLSISPIISLFFFLPLNLSSVHLVVITAFLFTWLGSFKLILFAFDHGPLSPPPAKLIHFISIACLPINPTPLQRKVPNFDKIRIPSFFLVTIKLAILALVFHIYNYRQFLPKSAVLALHICHLYIELETLLSLFAIPGRLLGFKLEPQFNEPYLSTSLQDFWGRRWNLMVPTILRLTVHYPVMSVLTPVVGPRWARLTAIVSSFLVSGLFHELIYYYWTHTPPTWEVTWFFVLHGVCTGIETDVKKINGSKWRLHPGISGLLTLIFLAVTIWWLFIPQLSRQNFAAMDCLHAITRLVERVDSCPLS